LKNLGIELRLVEAHAKQRDILRAEGLDKLVGPIQHGSALVDAVDEFLSKQS
jgi:hypothetical protein